MIRFCGKEDIHIDLEVGRRFSQLLSTVAILRHYASFLSSIKKYGCQSISCGKCDSSGISKHKYHP